MDRQGIVNEHDVERRFKDLSVEEQRALLASMGEPWRDYEPIHPRGTNWKRIAERSWAPIAALIGLAVKFGCVVFKFFGIFISVGAYALIWGWKFGVGFVLLILVHEMGHFVAAKLQGLQVTLPMFIPFVGAYVLIRNQPRDPYRNSLIALAGPAAGSVAAAACWAVAGTSDLLMALAYAGFLLNLINLFPAGWFDGGAVYRAYKQARHERSGAAFPIAALYVGLVLLLIAGMWATHVPQHRL
jgi:Zn-dependent protease